MPKLRTIGPLVRTLDVSTAKIRPPPKLKDPRYDTVEYRAWRTQVVARAGGRCEAIDSWGNRCAKAEPAHRMYADHKQELKDNGSLLDLNNGQCLCASH